MQCVTFVVTWYMHMSLCHPDTCYMLLNIPRLQATIELIQTTWTRLVFLSGNIHLKYAGMFPQPPLIPLNPIGSLEAKLSRTEAQHIHSGHTTLHIVTCHHLCCRIQSGWDRQLINMRSSWALRAFNVRVACQEWLHSWKTVFSQIHMYLKTQRSVCFQNQQISLHSKTQYHIILWSYIFTSIIISCFPESLFSPPFAKRVHAVWYVRR